MFELSRPTEPGSRVSEYVNSFPNIIILICKIVASNSLRKTNAKSPMNNPFRPYANIIIWWTLEAR